MAARFKLDENLSGSIAEHLRSFGHEVHSVRDEQMTGAADERLWSAVQSERRILLTTDLAFADVRKYPPGSHCGVVLFRLPIESRAGYVRLARIAIGQIDFSAINGELVVVTPGSVRVRRGA